MKRTLVKLRNNAILKFAMKYEKYAPIIFFIGGFIFDSLTLGRIDRTYDLTILSIHMASLTVALYLFNLIEDGKWKNTLLDRNKEYLPLAIQFFFGGLSSAYVIYFSRSVSLSKTITFFIILLALLVANEFLKKRISNKYLQFGVYFFINFTFFTFMIPVFIKEMNTSIFIISGLISLSSTLLLMTIIYLKSPSTRLELSFRKMLGIILSIYLTINLFYFFNLIPPVPLALDIGIVAHNIQKKDNTYNVTYEQDKWYVFWRDHKFKLIIQPNTDVYVFTSIFAPTEIKKSVLHRWKWYNNTLGEWEIVEDIGFEITGGRNAGFRGYTFKNNVKPGLWKVDVITEEGLVIGIVDFEIIMNSTTQPNRVIERKF